MESGHRTVALNVTEKPEWTSTLTVEKRKLHDGFLCTGGGSDQENSHIRLLKKKKKTREGRELFTEIPSAQRRKCSFLAHLKWSVWMKESRSPVVNGNVNIISHLSGVQTPLF